MLLDEKIMLRKRFVIETVFDILKCEMGLEHSPLLIRRYTIISLVLLEITFRISALPSFPRCEGAAPNG
jgi:hypothetical protein